MRVWVRIWRNRGKKKFRLVGSGHMLKACCLRRRYAKVYFWNRDAGEDGQMEYRKKIQELIGGVNDEKVLRFIYELLISFQKKWGV